jgi:hypothetical protein
MTTNNEWTAPITNKRTLMEILGEVADYRTGNSIRHKPKDVLIIGILCIICNGDTYTDMELFGETHEGELREFLELPCGIPSHDTFGDIFSRLDPAEISKCFGLWTESIKAEIEGHCVSIDGKTIRRSHKKGDERQTCGNGLRERHATRTRAVIDR